MVLSGAISWQFQGDCMSMIPTRNNKLKTKRVNTTKDGNLLNLLATARELHEKMRDEILVKFQEQGIQLVSLRNSENLQKNKPILPSHTPTRLYIKRATLYISLYLSLSLYICVCNSKVRYVYVILNFDMFEFSCSSHAL
ncbi:hypothetical protein ACJIZ3_017024 [Penstemon smallii]|uniref:Uncharacterized protein n=1 Tax=Penstemon smallii TaxID=265156 RepID=A0ABD3SUJ3_9LAMI